MASRGINKVILVGNLGNDPEIRHFPNGGSVANITIATSESWRDNATGEQKEKTEWHRVAIFGKLAEISGEYLRKGSQVYIEGQLQTRKWQDQSGQDRYTTEVVVQGFNGVMQMLGGRQEGQQGGWQQPQQQQAPQQQQQQAPQQQQQQAPQQQQQQAPQQQQQQQAPQHQQQQQAPQQQYAPQQQQAPQQQWSQPQQQAPQQPQQQYNEPPMDFDDDIPF